MALSSGVATPRRRVMKRELLHNASKYTYALDYDPSMYTYLTECLPLNMLPSSLTMSSPTDGILVFYTFVTQAIGGHTA